MKKEPLDVFDRLDNAIWAILCEWPTMAFVIFANVTASREVATITETLVLLLCIVVILTGATILGRVARKAYASDN